MSQSGNHLCKEVTDVSQLWAEAKTDIVRRETEAGARVEPSKCLSQTHPGGSPTRSFPGRDQGRGGPRRSLPLPPETRGHAHGAEIGLVHQRCLYPLDHRRSLPLVELCELSHPPLNRGKAADIGHLEPGLFWFLARDGTQELPVGIGHAADNLGDELRAGPDQNVQRDGNFHHPRETALELFAQVPARRRQQPLDGPMMAHQIDDEGSADEELVDRAFLSQHSGLNADNRKGAFDTLADATQRSLDVRKRPCPVCNRQIGEVDCAT